MAAGADRGAVAIMPTAASARACGAKPHTEAAMTAMGRRVLLVISDTLEMHSVEAPMGGTYAACETKNLETMHPVATFKKRERGP
jgi:hypothetical protein